MHHVKDYTGRIKAASSSVSPQKKGGQALLLVAPLVFSRRNAAYILERPHEVAVVAKARLVGYFIEVHLWISVKQSLCLLNLDALDICCWCVSGERHHLAM